MPDAPEKRFLTSFVLQWKNSFQREGRLPTAFLFAGPQGSGKGEAADEIAKTLLGRTENNPDLIRIVPEKKTPKSEKLAIRIETIRGLIHRLALRPFGNRRVVILDEAEMMTEEAANSLLKTLEEPPGDVLFILISAAPERLPATIRSRCQRVLFPVEKKEIQERLRTIYVDWGDSIAPLLSPPPPLPPPPRRRNRPPGGKAVSPRSSNS